MKPGKLTRCLEVIIYPWKTFFISSQYIRKRTGEDMRTQRNAWDVLHRGTNDWSVHMRPGRFKWLNRNKYASHEPNSLGIFGYICKETIWSHMKWSIITGILRKWSQRWLIRHAVHATDTPPNQIWGAIHASHLMENCPVSLSRVRPTFIQLCQI